MTFCQHALDLAARGFHVFPLIENGKTPYIEGWQNKASRDPNTIKSWWFCPILEVEQHFNIGIFTGKFGEDQALLVIDVDNKDGRNGSATLSAIISSKGQLPTAEVLTPTGGRHLFFVTNKPIKQGVDVLGDGLDTRSHGGYVVGAGSVTERGTYTWLTRPNLLTK